MPEATVEAPLDLRFEFRKLSDEGDGKPLTVTAIAAVISKADGSPVRDYDGHVIPIEEADLAVEDVLDSGGLTAGEMHERVDIGKVVGIMALDTEQRTALGFGAGPGGIFVKIRVTDPEVKRRIKNGELGELSIAGEAVEQAEAA